MMKREDLLSRLSALRHKSYVRTFSGLAPYYVINEFPKSGGTWLAQMLADAMDVPFRRNSPIRLEQSITHGHFYWPIGLRNTVVLWRDPRDLLVSFYFHCYFINDHNNAALVRMMKARCPFADYNNIALNLPNFIRFLSQTPVSPRFTWPSFARIWAERPNTVQTSYEKLRTDTTTELVRIYHALTGLHLPDSKAVEVVECNSFSRAKKIADENRPPTAEASFIREGSLGGWRDHFSHEALRTLGELKYNEGIVKLGYESLEKY